MGREIFYSTDFTKFLVDVVKEGDKEISYIWEAFYFRTKLLPYQGYQTTEDLKKPMWRIRKVVERDNWNMEVFYPEGDDSMRFVWNDRYSLNYI